MYCELKKVSIFFFLPLLLISCDKKTTNDEVPEAGKVWRNVSRQALASVDLYDVIWAGTFFIAVGETGTDSAVLLTSTDGEVWAEQFIPAQHGLRGIGTNGSQIIATGASGEVCTSYDGSNWTRRISDIPGNIGRIVHGNNLWVAVTDIAGECAVTSTDGITWTGQSLDALEAMYDITYDGSKYVAVGWRGQVFTSEDAVDWTTRFTGISQSLYGIACGNGNLVAVGSMGNTLISSDGVNWTANPTNDDYHLRDVVWNGRAYVAVGLALWYEPCILTGNGHSWQRQYTDFIKSLNAIAWNGEKFVAVGREGLILVSP